MNEDEAPSPLFKGAGAEDSFDALGDEVEVRERTSSRQLATRSMEESQARSVPEWLTLNSDALKATINRLPNSEETEATINVQLIVEYYSR